jgi:hypothetical protein
MNRIYYFSSHIGCCPVNGTIIAKDKVEAKEKFVAKMSLPSSEDVRFETNLEVSLNYIVLDEIAEQYNGNDEKLAERFNSLWSYEEGRKQMMKILKAFAERDMAEIALHCRSLSGEEDWETAVKKESEDSILDILINRVINDNERKMVCDFAEPAVLYKLNEEDPIL